MLTLALKVVPNVLGATKNPDGTYVEAPLVAGPWLHPDAAVAFAAVEASTAQLRVMRMYRSPGETRSATGRDPTLPLPGYSGHNFGFSIDLAVEPTLAAFKLSKEAFDALMVTYGWYCQRVDHQRGALDWHYNFLGSGSASEPYVKAIGRANNTNLGLERKIITVYGGSFQASTLQLKTQLAKLRIFNGPLDGELTPETQKAARTFQAQWLFNPSNIPDYRLTRVLAVVAADLAVTPAA